jgi:peptide/nickel transport system substrate-binding protein
MSADMLFLKNTSTNLTDPKVRQALTKATDVNALTAQIGYSVIPVREPLLRGQIGYNPAYSQAGFNKAEAAALLDDAGWKLAPGEQVRKKDGVPLKLNLSYETNADFSRIAGALQKQWADVGVELSVDVKQEDKNSLKLVDSHDYDVLLYGISIGPDPDVFAYWHSSQFDKKSPIHLNLSEYSSKVADLALEGGRTRIDPKLRAAKYKPFLEAWQKDAPAIGLYQPRFLYVSNQKIYGLDEQTINSPSDRFNDVYLWMIKTVRAEKS